MLFDRFLESDIFGRVDTMNLYLKYRPKTIEELDLTGVRKTLGDIVKTNNVAHAYLLTGPRGAGKTSTARVLARIVNCEKNDKKLGEPCNECRACKSILEGNAVDVIEIDAASNRGIDDIRELKEKIRLAPAILRKKVYIIDEVHMLTTEAFNALLKTLEEPPSHSLFILCTTELHKVPQTIVSRCVQIQFTKATPEEMQRSFARVVTGEAKVVSPEALAYLSMAVDGSFRDGVKILDQVLSLADEVGIGHIEQVVMGTSGYSSSALVEALVARDLATSLAKLNEAIVNGVDMSYLLVNLMRSLRDKLLSGEGEIGMTKLIFSLDEVARRLATSLDGELLIQVAFVEWCGNDDAQEEGKKKFKIEKKPIETPKPEPASSNQKETIKEAASTSNHDIDPEVAWQKIVGTVGKNNLALDTIISRARAGKIYGDELMVYVKYDFHRQQLMSDKNRIKFEEIISSVVGRPIRVKCEVSSDKASELKNDTMTETLALEDDLVSQAESIFIS